MKVIQVKLQKQLVARHQKLQEDILRQQQELQNVQQQLLNAQQLMFQQQSPVMGMSLDQTLTRGQKASPPPVKGGNWKTAGGLVHHQPAVTEAWSMNLPMQQRYMKCNRLWEEKKTKMWLHAVIGYFEMKVMGTFCRRESRKLGKGCHFFLQNDNLISKNV